MNSTRTHSRSEHGSIIFALTKFIINMLLITILACVLLTILFSVAALRFETDAVLVFMRHMLVLNQGYLQQGLFSTFKLFQYVDTLMGFTLNELHYGYAFLLKNSDGFFKLNFIVDHESTLIDYLSIIIHSLIITLSRVLIFVNNLPFLIVLLSLSCIDGLCQRDIRKFQGARESTFIFHKIKPLIGFSFMLNFLLYLIVPFAVSPVLFLVPLSILICVLSMVSVKNFKKYV